MAIYLVVDLKCLCRVDSPRSWVEQIPSTLDLLGKARVILVSAPNPCYMLEWLSPQWLVSVAFPRGYPVLQGRRWLTAQGNSVFQGAGNVSQCTSLGMTPSGWLPGTAPCFDIGEC